VARAEHGCAVPPRERRASEHWGAPDPTCGSRPAGPVLHRPIEESDPGPQAPGIKAHGRDLDQETAKRRAKRHLILKPAVADTLRQTGTFQVEAVSQFLTEWGWTRMEFAAGRFAGGGWPVGPRVGPADTPHHHSQHIGRSLQHRIRPLTHRSIPRTRKESPLSSELLRRRNELVPAQGEAERRGDDQQCGGDQQAEPQSLHEVG
jgi:hypothetical protein